jgi:hypothetical protein
MTGDTARCVEPTLGRSELHHPRCHFILMLGVPVARGSLHVTSLTNKGADMSTTPKRQRACWPLMVVLTINGALVACWAFAIIDGSPPNQLVTAAQIINPRPSGSATWVVSFFSGRVGYTHSSPNPGLVDLEQGFWNWAPITSATFIGALAGTLTAYLINRWLIQGTVSCGKVT